ncbi:MAG: FAD-binding oxidoreductase [Ascidiaceihabitans sp.]|nr:FAD-binding oxidoreductase [Ascidiaceihabitans sp.]
MTYSAARTPVHQGPAAWADILGNGAQYPTLETEISADVVVIGAGFAGLSAALRVQQLDPTAKVAVLEAGRVAQGAAGRNSGFMIDLPHDLASDDYAGAGDDQLLTRLNRQAIAFGAEAAETFGIAPAYFDKSGKVNGAASAAGDAHNRSYESHLRTLGETSAWLDAQSMHELTGSRHYVSGLFTPGTVMLQPAGYIRGLATGVARHANLFENSAVLSFARAGQSWCVKTAKGQVTAAKVILALNGHLESFGIAKGRLMQLFLFASMTSELDSEMRARLGGADRWGVTPSDPMGTTVRRIDTGQGGHRIVTRTCAVMRPDMQASAGDVGRAAKVQRAKFAARFPQLAGLKMQYEWAGHLCLSLNGVAVAGAIEDGVYSACVQNGLGTARGTLTGMAAAETAMGHPSEITQFFLAEAAPKRLPPQPFAKIGANAYLRWKEWRAGAE